MNPFKIVGILIMWIYDIVMLPFVLLWNLGKALAFFAFVMVVSFIIWLLVFS